ncbi:LacI family DNA-binding transcriptional regulator [Clostridium ganghwense]|uniref:LacI family DNA-binding transcriptional regulator n=1 Tax=Clostridium ganghwense TaxID=312089 RepID=A0ABT4CMM3_9CLOT|nr:LacI family DNA-binding transcriptional regulator [Clostridium ganghwense]MCY6369346.1 LacI family DNA-binding transcriptional regulator [Clostridium ganghwense]
MKSKVTIKDVAKEAGVSTATVSYVINGVDKVTEETRAKILKIIDELGYKPNLAARSLVKKENRVVGIFVPWSESYQKTIFTENPFFQEFLSGVEYKCREYRYNTLIICVKDEDECIKTLRSGSLSGLIVLGEYNKNIYKRLEEVDIPVIMIDHQKISDKFTYISSENEKGAYLATEYLIKKGHKNIGFLGHPAHKDRYEGYLEALKKYNIDPKSDFVFESEVSYEGGKKVALLVKEKVEEITAICCVSDIMAIGLIKGLYKEKIYVPQHISVVGFDDIKNSEYFIPELTTIRQDIFRKGEKAAEVVIDSVNTKNYAAREYVMPVELIERESVVDSKGLAKGC